MSATETFCQEKMRCDTLAFTTCDVSYLNDDQIMPKHRSYIAQPANAVYSKKGISAASEEIIF